MVFTCLSLDYCISIKWLAIVWAAHPVYNGHLNSKHHASLVCTVEANTGEGNSPQLLKLIGYFQLVYLVSKLHCLIEVC